MAGDGEDRPYFVNAVWLPTSPPRPAPPLLTAEEAILMLRIEGRRPLATLRRYETMGLIRATQIGKHSRYRLQEVLSFIDQKQKDI